MRYAAEQPQGLPAVIAKLTRWAAQNLELTLKSEINVGSRLSEKGGHPEAEDHEMQQGVNQALARRSKSRRMETRKGGEAKDRFSSASHCRINN